MNSSNLVVVPLEDLKSIISHSISQELEKINTPSADELEAKEDVLLTRKETAKLLNVCVATLDNWTREGKLTKYRNGSVVRYNRKEVISSFTSLQKYKR